MNIRPLADRVLIKLEKVEKKSEGGIFLPGTSADSDPVYGKVVAVGNGRISTEVKVIPVSVKEDSTVLLYKHAGTAVKLEGEDYVIAHESDLLAVVE